jgi:hypothetical protein
MIDNLKEMWGELLEGDFVGRDLEGHKFVKE